MKNPFSVGDKVYTPEGEFYVGSVEESGCYIGKDTDYKKHDSRWTPTFMLSFKPWPAPCHERPVEDGWWICSDKTQREPLPLVRKVFKGKVEYTVGLTTVNTHLDKWDFHRYLGKDWK